MAQHILTVNAGSSSLKFALYDRDTLQCLTIGMVDGLGTAPHLVLKDGAGKRLLSEALEGERSVSDQQGALRIALQDVDRQFPELTVTAVGHRVVHGGLTFTDPVLVDDTVYDQLRALVALAPLHQPHNLAGIDAAREAFPSASQVACFDTGFHRGHAFVNDAYALPRSFYDEGVRRYGFHGLSYEYVSSRLAEIAPSDAAGRVVVCHLGSGASMCAIQGGRSVSSTMGFTALDGLPMGTRPGQIDPGVLLYLMDAKGMGKEEISILLYKESGLKGLSTISNDMRELEASTDPRAKQAIDYLVARIRREIGAMAADLGGLDAVVFTGGIGENSQLIRARVLEEMDWLGLSFDTARNAAGDAIISADGSRVRAYVIPTNEELMIARHTRRLIGADS